MLFVLLRTPYGVILLATDSLIGSDSDIVLLPSCQIGYRLGYVRGSLDGHGFISTGKCAAGAVLNLISGRFGVLRPLDKNLL